MKFTEFKNTIESKWAEKITENIGKSINKIYEMLKADISDGKIHKNHIDILLANIK